MTSKKSAYHHGNLRTELKTAALDILDKEGIDAVTIRKVARTVGVAHSAPVNHFKDKRALLTTLAIDVTLEISVAIRQRLEQPAGSLPDKVHRIASSLLEYGLHSPNRYRLLWRGDCLNNDDPALSDAMDSIYDQLLKVLENNPNDTKESVESQAIALWSLLHGYVTMRLDGVLIAKTDEKSGALREQAIIDVLLNGICSD